MTCFGSLGEQAAAGLDAAHQVRLLRPLARGPWAPWGPSSSVERAGAAPGAAGLQPGPGPCRRVGSGGHSPPGLGPWTRLVGSGYLLGPMLSGGRETVRGVNSGRDEGTETFAPV